MQLLLNIIITALNEWSNLEHIISNRTTYHITWHYIQHHIRHLVPHHTWHITPHITSPIDWATATTLPTATVPPFAMAADDIRPAAYDPDATPAPVKPTAPNITGAATTAPTPVATAQPPYQATVLQSTAKPWKQLEGILIFVRWSVTPPLCTTQYSVVPLYQDCF